MMDLSREEGKASIIAKGLENSISKLFGKVLSTRKLRRTIVRIVNIDEEFYDNVIDAIIPGWNPYTIVRFPASLIPENIRDALKVF